MNLYLTTLFRLANWLPDWLRVAMANVAYDFNDGPTESKVTPAHTLLKFELLLKFAGGKILFRCDYWTITGKPACDPG